MAPPWIPIDIVWPQNGVKMASERAEMMAAFSSALIDCIREARLPLDAEITSLAEKIWDEGLRFVPGCSFETALSAAVQVLSAGIL